MTEPSDPAWTDTLTRELNQLRRWKAEASSLFDEIQDLGRALGVPLGVLITGPLAVKAAAALTARAERAEEQVAAVEAVVRSLSSRYARLCTKHQGDWDYDTEDAIEADVLKGALDGVRAALAADPTQDGGAPC